MRSERKSIFWLAPVALLAIAVASPEAHAQATIELVNADAPSVGLNDATPAAPVGSNAGTTLGEQRLIALQYAAKLWGDRLPRSARIRIQVNFAPLQCDANWALFGSSGPIEEFRDFRGAPRSGTWYPAALANTLSGSDLDPNQDDIQARFSSTLDDGSCAFPARWYYGLDAKGPWDRIDFVSMASHELAHGLGFQTVVNLSTGGKLAGKDDVFMTHLVDEASGKAWPSLSDSQRVASAASGKLAWQGDDVRRVALTLAQGTEPDGHVKMYSPNQLVGGSSVAHFDESVKPADVMAPYYTEATRSMELAASLLRDIGWSVAAATAAPTYTWFVPSSAKVAGAGGAYYTTDLTVANRGNLDATFTIKFLGNNADGRGGPETTFNLGPGKAVTYADVLGSVFSLASGWGALRIRSNSPSLQVAAQTGTPGAAGGSFGQGVPGAGAADFVTSAAAKAIIAVREDSVARTNLVVANTTEQNVDVLVTALSGDGGVLGSWSATLQPLEMRQISQVLRAAGATGNVTNAQLVLSTPSASGAFAAYASVIDNNTNDPKTLLPR